MQASSETTTASASSSAPVSSSYATNVGAFGEVRMCQHRETGAQRAVKVLKKSHMDEDEKKMLFNEINILRGLVS
jgi:serine/threonine protein kinase